MRRVEVERDDLSELVRIRLILRSPSRTECSPLWHGLRPKRGSEQLIGRSVVFRSLVVINQSDTVARLSFHGCGRVEGVELEGVQLSFPLEALNSSHRATVELAPRSSVEVALRGELRFHIPSEGAKDPELLIQGLEAEDLAAPGAPRYEITAPPVDRRPAAPKAPTVNVGIHAQPINNPSAAMAMKM